MVNKALPYLLFKVREDTNSPGKYTHTKSHRSFRLTHLTIRLSLRSNFLLHLYSVLRAYHPSQRQVGHGFLLTACLRCSSLSAATIGSSFFRWYAIRWLMLSNNMSLVRTCVASAANQHVTKCAKPLLLASHWRRFVLSHTHHSLWIHQQQVFGQATVHPSQHVLARVSGALPDQEVSVPDQESFCVPSAHAAVIPRLST